MAKQESQRQAARKHYLQAEAAGNY